jgi:hypothetical protein
MDGATVAPIIVSGLIVLVAYVVLTCAGNDAVIAFGELILHSHGHAPVGSSFITMHTRDHKTRAGGDAGASLALSF